MKIYIRRKSSHDNWINYFDCSTKQHFIVNDDQKTYLKHLAGSLIKVLYWSSTPHIKLSIVEFKL